MELRYINSLITALRDVAAKRRYKGQAQKLRWMTNELAWQWQKFYPPSPSNWETWDEAINMVAFQLAGASSAMEWVKRYYSDDQESLDAFYEALGTCKVALHQIQDEWYAEMVRSGAIGR